MEEKKNKKVDLERKRNLHLTIGLLLSMALVTLAFEWKTSFDPVVDIPEQDVVEAFLPPVPVTIQTPPKPKVPEIKIIEVDNEEEVVADISFELPTFDDPVENPLEFETPEKEKSEDILIFAEEQPSFPGGESAFYQYVSKNMKYPRLAVRSEVEGKVYVQFVVDTDGSLSEVKVLKGIGGGCDEEALRVLQNSPRWNPGKQRGRAVRVRMTIPIIFKLQ